MPKELLKRAAKKYPILFRCAKHSILPNKTETSEKAVRSFYGQNSTAQSHKIGYFLTALFPIVFVQSGSKTFTAAVYSKFYKLIGKFRKSNLSIIFCAMLWKNCIFENSQYSGESSNSPRDYDFTEKYIKSINIRFMRSHTSLAPVHK